MINIYLKIIYIFHLANYKYKYMNTSNNNYLIKIFERYGDLKKSNKKDLDNYDLSKIFEYYSCIKLSEELLRPFYEYDDIDPNFKEIYQMTRNDTGIDCCDLINTIVQCKLRSKSLCWKECSTFFGSQTMFDKELGKTIIKWENLIIARNKECIISESLLARSKLFIDKTYCRKDIIDFCENLLITPPRYPVFNDESFKLRDYQNDCIDLIKKTHKNIIICLPTGTGKNLVIIYSMNENLKYLILVPKIILMDQLKNEIIKHNPKMKSKIQLIGDNNNVFNEDKNITICVFNSVSIVASYGYIFKNIFIDEAHHINKPMIYYDEESIEEIIDESFDESFDEDESVDNLSEVLDDPNDEFVNIKNYTQIIKSLDKYNNNVYLSSRNLKKAKVVTAADLNTYDVLNAGTLLLTTETVKKLEEAFAK